MNILCCGDRNWHNITKIRNTLLEYQGQNITIIHGNARGADREAALVGMTLGFKIKSYPAQWAIYGKTAGPVRNQQMLDEGKPDLVIAFHNDLDKSKGTKDMVKRARLANITVKLITELS